MIQSVDQRTFSTKARRETDESHQILLDVLEQARLNCTQIIFPAAAVNPTAGLLSTPVNVDVADANSVRQLLGDNRVKRARVNITGGTATGKLLTNDEGGTGGTNLIVEFRKGRAIVTVSATSTGTVTLSLTDVDSSGLTVTDTVTVTFS
jgi:hypothetical protein